MMEAEIRITQLPAEKPKNDWQLPAVKGDREAFSRSLQTEPDPFKP